MTSPGSATARRHRALPERGAALGATKFTPVAALRRAGRAAASGSTTRRCTPAATCSPKVARPCSSRRVAGDPLEPAVLLDMLTIEGATAIGLAQEIGSLEPGKHADLVILDASGPHWWPRADTWPATVATCARASDVRAVLVDGRLVASHGVPTVPADGPALGRAARRLREQRGW